MKKRLLGVVTAVTAALVLVAAAMAATSVYTKPSLSVSYSGSATRIVAKADVTEDATARAAIIVSEGTSINTSAGPGTKVGTAQAQVSALALGGALLPLAGDIVVAPPGAIPAASQTACIGALPPSASYLLTLAAAGQTINLPAYIVPTAGAQIQLGASQLVFCLPNPEIPADQGGATFGAKFLSADLTFNGVFSPLREALWLSFWTPWTPGANAVNPAGTVAAGSLILPGAVTIKGKRTAGKITLTGKVTYGGNGFAEIVQVWGAAKTGALKRLKTVVAKQDGTFTFALGKAAKQTRFQARVVSPEFANTPEESAKICARVYPNNQLGVPCSGWTLNAFTAQSKVISVR
ncbi:MAG: hypothetical protein ACKVUT_15160 [Gaiella sp.]